MSNTSSALLLAMACAAVLSSPEVRAQNLIHTPGALPHPPRAGLFDTTGLPVEGGFRMRTSMMFVTNRGQWDPRALFQASSGPMAVFLENRGMTLVLRRQVGERREGVAVRIAFPNGAAAPRVEGEHRLPGVNNYLIGDEPGGWHTGVPTFGAVRYHGLLPGVDLWVHDRSGNLEYDVHCAPGADPTALVMRVEGVDRLTVAANGALRMENRFADLIQLPPKCWQVTPEGSKEELPCRFEVVGTDRYRFVTDGRNPELALVIDPIVTWATFAGGSLTDETVALDRAGNGQLTIGGRSSSIDYPTSPGVFQGTHGGSTWDGFVMRLDPGKSGAAQRLWATYIGGSQFDAILELVVDAQGVTTAVGYSFSTDYPIGGIPYQGTKSSTQDADAVITRLRSDGSAPIYSTYIGGTSDEHAADVVLDPTDVTGSRIFVAGYTESSNFPTVNAAQPVFGGGRSDAFVLQLDTAMPTSGLQLVWSTFLGGNQEEGFWMRGQSGSWNVKDLAMSLSPGRDLAVVTQTGGGSFPGTPGTWCPSPPGNPGKTSSVSVTRLQSNGRHVWTTFVGGTVDDGWDIPRSVAFDTDDSVTVAGLSYSPDFPTTTGALCQTMSSRNGPKGAHDAIFFALSGDGKQLRYSTFLGGAFATAISEHYLESSGAAILAGWAFDYIPLTPGAQKPRPQSWEAIQVRLMPGGQGLQDLMYSSFFGGTGQEAAWDVVPASGGESAAVGTASSSDFPVSATAFQRNYSGGTNDGWAGHLKAIPVAVDEVRDPSPPCASAGGPIFVGAPSWARRTYVNTHFGLTCTGAPATTTGFLGLGLQKSVPLPGGVILHVDPLLVLTLASDPRGYVHVRLPVPSSAPAGLQITAQFIWGGTTTCGPMIASGAVTVTIQP